MLYTLKQLEQNYDDPQIKQRYPNVETYLADALNRQLIDPLRSVGNYQQWHGQQYTTAYFQMVVAQQANFLKRVAYTFDRYLAPSAVAILKVAIADFIYFAITHDPNQNTDIVFEHDQVAGQQLIKLLMLNLPHAN